MTDIAGYFLDSLTTHAECVAHHSAEISRSVDYITTMPSFRTRGEANLDKAEAALKAALETVKAAKKQLRPGVKLKVAS